MSSECTNYSEAWQALGLVLGGVACVFGVAILTVYLIKLLLSVGDGK